MLSYTNCSRKIHLLRLAFHLYPLPFHIVKANASNSTLFSESFKEVMLPRIAVIGSGPSGLYACARLLQKLPDCQIDVFEKSQAPFGLVYYGVAPDHIDMKKSMNSFERMFIENRDRLALFCNVDVNSDLCYEELCDNYEAVILAYGANKARKLGLSNEDAPNIFSGGAFVSWYNGFPQPNGPVPILDEENVVVIGNGNVAIDCSRILLSDTKRLAQTDIKNSALNILKKSKVRNVRILGRRGPREAAFTIKELRELLGLDNVNTYCAISKIKDLHKELPNMERRTRRLMELMLTYSNEERRNTVGNLNQSFLPSDKHQKSLILEFNLHPIEIEVDSSRFGRVCALKVENALTGEQRRLPCGLLIYAIGFENILLNGVPRTEDGRLAMIDGCRVPERNAAVYAIGWCSHAARGLIADSQQQAYTIADQIIEDWQNGRIESKPITTSTLYGRGKVEDLLKSRRVCYINWDDWKYIDECERRMGALLGKSREKITDFISILRIMRNH